MVAPQLFNRFDHRAITALPFCSYNVAILYGSGRRESWHIRVVNRVVFMPEVTTILGRSKVVRGTWTEGMEALVLIGTWHEVQLGNV